MMITGFPEPDKYNCFWIIPADYFLRVTRVRAWEDSEDTGAGTSLGQGQGSCVQLLISEDGQRLKYQEKHWALALSTLLNQETRKRHHSHKSVIFHNSNYITIVRLIISMINIYIFFLRGEVKLLGKMKSKSFTLYLNQSIGQKLLESNLPSCAVVARG